MFYVASLCFITILEYNLVYLQDCNYQNTNTHTFFLHMVDIRLYHLLSRKFCPYCLDLKKCLYLCSAQQCVGTGSVTVYRQRGIDGCPIFILPLSVCSPL